MMTSRRFFTIGAFCILAGVSACGQGGGSETAAPEGAAVGMTRLAYEDPARMSWNGTTPRPLMTQVWYPAAEGSEMTEFVIPADRPVFTGGFAARDAALAQDQKKRPLVIMSHGTGGSAFQMMWLGRELAARGYIAAAVDHHGNTAAEEDFDPRGFRLPWERALDLSEVISLLLEDETFGPSIDETRISAIGFSLGGYTVTALAGGETDMEKFVAFCAGPDRDTTCEKQAEFPEAGTLFDEMLANDPDLQILFGRYKLDFADPRVSRFIALGPALGQAFTEPSLSRIEAPFLFIAGRADEVAPPLTNAEYLASHIPNASIQLIPDAGHYVFLNECTPRGRRFVPVCKDPDGVSRASVHDETVGLVLQCLEGELCPIPPEYQFGVQPQ